MLGVVGWVPTSFTLSSHRATLPPPLLRLVVFEPITSAAGSARENSLLLPPSSTRNQWPGSIVPLRVVTFQKELCAPVVCTDQPPRSTGAGPALKSST